MLRIYRAEKGVLSLAPQIERPCWVCLTSPTEEELQYVQESLKVFPEFLRYPLDEEEIPRIELEEDQLLIILRVPDPRHEEGFIRYETIPIGIILTEEAIITVCLKENPVFEDFLMALNKVKNFTLERPIPFLFHFFWCIATIYLRYLRLIDKLITEYEQELYRSMRNKELLKLLNIEKSLVYFNTALRANDIVLSRLQSGRFLRLTEDDLELLEDVQIENRQAIDMAKIFSDILTGTMDAYASVISNNLNMVMKFLTSATIVLMLPTLVASIYGMNIQLPLQNSPHAFAILMTISFILSGIVVALFIKKRLF
ncbi:Mg2 transporter protein CorA family protein [Thermodesulfatator indicus DSM 15286]|uniref:Mg2 transporter protein CorA family protein n=1 Tax=Thermodesulfatator indicus (strain DSM 15286 / JCM 11887 / CIR29812) TaxID=667014 RepID=F8ABS5_THEID|nr:magnesium transporter CorA family protein [Thermodesulfatator indicus]AEH44528.1 Mg2 transporter protein CorA family protein [Thermodesulfatator indicus DSM 15286]